jgi:hypothetical protein
MLGRCLLSRFLSTHRIGMFVYQGFEPIYFFGVAKSTSGSEIRRHQFSTRVRLNGTTASSKRNAREGQMQLGNPRWFECGTCGRRLSISVLAPLPTKRACTRAMRFLVAEASARIQSFLIVTHMIMGRPLR